jgi:phosphatidylglycerol:prolipoprotein diacylglycerol transferase
VQFPVYVWLGPVPVHPHFLFESLAYLFGARIYGWVKARQGDAIAPDDRWWVVAAAAVGAALGGKLVYWLSDPVLFLQSWRDPFLLMGGKSVVGALVGGLVAVEWAKRRLGLTRSTGDLFALPLAIGIAVGRIGCFLTGLDDHTHGLPTTLPWAVDFGDGLARHPTQLYEIAFLLPFAGWLWVLANRPHREGDVFRLFMVGYLGFRVLLEAIKPGVALLGLNAIQWVCLATLAYYAAGVRPVGRLTRRLRLDEVSGG